MKRNLVFIVAIGLASFAACNSVQKSVDPSGHGPVPRGSERSVDHDTIKPPANDTTRTGSADSPPKQG